MKAPLNVHEANGNLTCRSSEGNYCTSNFKEPCLSKHIHDSIYKYMYIGFPCDVDMLLRFNHYKKKTILYFNR